MNASLSTKTIRKSFAQNLKKKKKSQAKMNKIQQKNQRKKDNEEKKQELNLACCSVRFVTWKEMLAAQKNAK